jgi:hypothetical protein
MADKTPDPLEHLSVYEKTLLIAMVPTFHERQRMRFKGTDRKSRETLIIEFLLERRGIYEHCFKEACTARGIEPPRVRNVMTGDRLSRYKSLMNEAAGRASELRVPEADRDQSLQQYIHDPDADPPRKRLRR